MTVRRQHPTPPTIPVRVCSSEELELLVTLNDVSIDAFLQEFMTDRAKHDWRIRSGLHEHQRSRNAVLGQAISSYDWAIGVVRETP